MKYNRPKLSYLAPALSTIQSLMDKGGPPTDNVVYGTPDFRPTTPAYEADE